MDYIIKVSIKGQQLKFEDCHSLHIYHPEIYDRIIIKPTFSSDWDNLYKQIGFSIDHFEYIYANVEEEEIAIPVKFKCAPGVAIHFIGTETSEAQHNYHLPTNFLKITMGDVKCQF